MDRRKFVKLMGMTGVAAAIPWQLKLRDYKLSMARAYPFAQSTPLPKFVNTLAGLGPTGKNNVGNFIQLASKSTFNFLGLNTDTYFLGVKQFKQRLDPALPGSTTFWGYFDETHPLQQNYLGGVVVAKRNQPVLFNVTNWLANKHILPVDGSVMAGPAKVGGPNLMVMDLPVNRIVTHLHGGVTPWFSDGTPFQWFTPIFPGTHGPSFMNVPHTLALPGTATYYYPNQQSARMVWYHDHAIGLTRLNAYAGIASAYIITDDFESYLVNQKLVPDLVGVPLIVQDKTFVPNNINDPGWQWGGPGSLWYPHKYEQNIVPDAVPPTAASTPNPSGRWDYGPTFGFGLNPPDPTQNAVLPNGPPFNPANASFYTLPDPSLVPEYFSDTALVNGVPYPVLNIPAQTFRFRILNASQARFWHLSLYKEDPSNLGEPLANSGGTPPQGGYFDQGGKFGPRGSNIAFWGVPGPPLYQIGTEGGFLPAVATHDNATPLPRDGAMDATGAVAFPDGPFNLLLAPAERADLLVDFTDFAGQSFILYNDAGAPFPMGDPRNDYFTHDPNFADPNANVFGLGGGALSTNPGFGPNTRTVMKIMVGQKPQNPPPRPDLGKLNTALGNNFKPGPGNPGATPQRDALLAHLVSGQFVAFPGANGPFNKTLNEDFDEYGRLLQRGGIDVSLGSNNQGITTFGRGYLEAPTETPNKDEIQIWDLYNLTADTHPWHFHIVNVQIIGWPAPMDYTRT